MVRTIPANAPVKILLSRPEAQSRRFVMRLDLAFPEVPGIIVSPVLKATPRMPAHWPVDVDALILTSQNAVEPVRKSGLYRGITAYCVGDATARAAIQAGFDAISAQGTSADLVALIRQRCPGKLLYARGVEISRDIGADLSVHGIAVEEVTVYDQRPQPLGAAAVTALRGAAPVLIPLFSARSALALQRQFTADMTAPKQGLCLSDAVRQAVNAEMFATVATCAGPTADAMISLIGLALGR